MSHKSQEDSHGKITAAAEQQLYSFLIKQDKQKKNYHCVLQSLYTTFPIRSIVSHVNTEKQKYRH